MGALDEPSGRDLVVVGASAGGVETLARLMAKLPADLPAAVLVVVHISPVAQSFLPEILDRAGPLPVAAATHGARVERGRVYVAPPDRHMLVAEGTLHLVHGPRENRHRPAIDPLFRSAALAYRRRVIGIILSGTLGDGAAGMHAVSRLGGVGIVQDPGDALYPGMPESAIAADRPSHVLPLAAIPRLVVQLVRSPLPRAGEDEDTTDEPDSGSHLAELDLRAVRPGAVAGRVAPFRCPECGEALRQVGHDPVLFRCRIGHALAGDGLLAGQSDTVDSALWSAFSALEERASLARRIADRVAIRGTKRAHASAARYLERADEADAHAAVIRELLAGKNAEVI